MFDRFHIMKKMNEAVDQVRRKENKELCAQGIELLKRTRYTWLLTAYLEPPDPAYHYDRLHDALFDRGFTIYPGKGAKKATFRLANMGAIGPDDMRRFVEALSAVLEAQGIERRGSAPM